MCTSSEQSKPKPKPESDGFWAMSVGEREASLRALEREIRAAGASPKGVLDRCRRDSPFATRLGKFAALGAVEPIDERLARRIMGKNFWGQREWQEHYGVTLSARQRKAVSVFPWGEDVLDAPCPFVEGKKVSETHFAFLGIPGVGGKPLTIMNWQKIHPAGSQPRFYLYGSGCLYPNEEFANAALGPGWYLGLINTVPGSASTSWADMQSMIPEEYYVPSPAMEVAKDFLCYQRHRKYPNLNLCVATDEFLDSSGDRVVVGRCDGDGVGVDGWDSLSGCRVGLSLFRKPWV